VRPDQREGGGQHLIQVHIANLAQPPTPGKVTKRGPLSGGKEQDLDGAFLKWAQLTPGPLRDWLVRASESAEYPAIREFRHGFTHRLVSRHVKVLLGQPTRSEFESEVGNFRQTAIAHLQMAAPFAVAQFSAFCDAAIDQYQ
jgi:hypothetical protein